MNRIAIALVLLAGCARPPEPTVTQTCPYEQGCTTDRANEADEQLAKEVRGAYLVYWRAHDDWLAAENEVNAASKRARDAGLVVGNDYDKCGSVPTNDNRVPWIPKIDRMLECLEIYRKFPR